MSKSPEIRVDEDGTTWILVGHHGGKAYYARQELLVELVEAPPVYIEMPLTRPLADYGMIRGTHINAPGRRIVITGLP